MTIIRKEFQLRSADETPYSYAYLKKYIDRYPELKLNQIIETIFEEHARMEKALAERDNLANSISQQVLDELKTPLSVTRVRTGYIDKNVRAMILILNSFLLMRGLDDKLPIKEIDFTAKPIEEALEKITAEIQDYRTANKYKKETDQA